MMAPTPTPLEHWGVFIDNDSRKEDFIDALVRHGQYGELGLPGSQTGALFSKSVLETYMDGEDRHDIREITTARPQSLRSMSSGERNRSLLTHLLAGTPDYLILDNPFDNLDPDTRSGFTEKLIAVAKTIPIVQIISRKGDILPFINRFARLNGTNLIKHPNLSSASGAEAAQRIQGSVPPPPTTQVAFAGEILVDMRKVAVSFDGRPILRDIDWTIRTGEYWELRGNNGSGKTTLLTMVTGENPKGYGQELYLFGRKRGTGESIWDIKKLIGYFTPAMTDKFMGYHSVLHMIISGLTDSIGLYQRPTESQLRLAKQWLTLIGMSPLQDARYHDLSQGQKRMVMCARAMIKHPTLLILDEPTAGLDDASAMGFVGLVNTFAKGSDTAVVFVSHRREPGLEAEKIYALGMTDTGSEGRVIQ